MAGRGAAQTAAPNALQIATQLRDRAIADPMAYDIVQSLTVEVGARLAGTPAAARAKDWGLAKLTQMGFSNVRAEPFPVTAWVRGAESAEVTAPFPQRLAVMGLGNSVPTPAGGIEAPIAYFATYEDMLATAPGALDGRIAVVNQPMPANQDGSGYGMLNAARRRGASEAARRGAVAYLVRSLSGDPTSRLPHVGAMNYTDGVPRIPCAALAVTDADQLGRMVGFRAPVRVRLQLASTTTPNAPAWNVSGEIRGTETPNEIIVIGGHLDSWDVGTGAIDDAAGIGITTAAAWLIGQAVRRPRRTIRVVMFGAEETDFSAAAYFAAHRDEVPNLVLCAESDGGADRIMNVMLPPNAAGAPAMAGLSNLLAPLMIGVSPEIARRSGADMSRLVAAGVPALAFRQDTSRYFLWHHSDDDTLDKVDRAQLNQNVAAWAATLYLLADSGIDFRAGQALPAPRPA